MIAEARNVDLRRIRDLHDHLTLAGFQRHAVDFDIDRVVAHRPPYAATAAAASARLTVDDRAALVLDHVLKLVPEMLQEALHRPRGRIAQRADGVALDAIGHIEQQAEILAAALRPR